MSFLSIVIANVRRLLGRSDSRPAGAFAGGCWRAIGAGVEPVAGPIARCLGVPGVGDLG